MSVQYFVSIHLADVEIFHKINESSDLMVALKVNGSESVGSILWGTWMSVENIKADQAVVELFQSGPKRWADRQPGIALGTKKCDDPSSQASTQDLPPRVKHSVFFRVRRGEICGCIRGLTPDITDSWEQLACLSVEVRSAALLSTAAFTSAEGLKDYFPPVS